MNSPQVTSRHINSRDINAVLRSTIKTDPLAKATLTLAAAISILCLFLPADTLKSAGTTRSITSGFLVVLVAALAYAVRKINDHEERRFWLILAAAASFWLIAVVPLLFFPYGEAPFGVNLVADLSISMYYVAFVLGLERQPHRRGQESNKNFSALHLPAISLFVFGVLIYMVLLPVWLHFETYRIYLPPLWLYVVLDSFLTIRLAFFAWSSGKTHWRLIYSLLGTTTALMLVADFVGLLTTVAIANFFYAFSLIFFILAARIGQLTADEREEQALDDGVREPGWQTMAYALTFPLMHLLFSLLGGFDQESRQAREVFTLIWTALLGFFAVLQNHYLEKSQKKLEEGAAELNEELAWRKEHQAEREHFITQLEKKTAELENKTAELENKTAELERFTYTVSHDLKSPLFTIQGFLGSLEEDAAAGRTDRMGDDISTIRSAAHKMSQLLHELLELSRIGRVGGEPEDVALFDLTNEAAEMVSRQIQERGVDLRISSDLPVVLGDRPRLLEVMQNLIDNAVKYMGEQGEPCVEVAQRQDGDETVLYVQDNGIGIDPRYHENVFGLFSRLDSEAEGTGVGLALVKRIIDVHGGRIWVESDGIPGQGCRMCFTLPG